MRPPREVPDGQALDPNDGGRRDQVLDYQYRHDRARRTLRGNDEQVRKAEQAVAGNAPVKRNRFIQLSGGTKTVNRGLEDKAGLAVSRWIEQQTGWSIRTFVKTARGCRTIQIQAGDYTLTAADPIPDDLRTALDPISRARAT